MHGKTYLSKACDAQVWGPWSDWKWSTEDRQYYAERYDVRGNVEYAWRNSRAPTRNEHQYTPRNEIPIGQLTTDFGSLNVNSAGYSHDQGIQYSNSGYLVGDPAPDLSGSTEYTTNPLFGSNHDESHSHSYGNSGKGKASAYSQDAYRGQGYDRFGSLPPLTGELDPHYSQTISLEPQADQSVATTMFQNSNPGAITTTNSSYNSQSNTNTQLEQALETSRYQLFGNRHSGEPSNSGALCDKTAAVYAGTYAPDPLNDCQLTKTQTDFTNSITGTPENFDLGHLADSRFVVETSYKFQPGEVFKILWSEPTGQVTNDFPISDRRAMTGPGGLFYIGYRRFIIVTTDESHHSTCVPILTYDRRGCSKKGVRPDKHGIIYAQGHKPHRLKDEPDLGFSPVPLKIYAEGETLARESRVNYSKLVTIEHNFKVFFIGRIPAPYFENVVRAVDQCWSEKMHKSSKKSRR